MGRLRAASHLPSRALAIERPERRRRGGWPGRAPACSELTWAGMCGNEGKAHSSARNSLRQIHSFLAFVHPARCWRPPRPGPALSGTPRASPEGTPAGAEMIVTRLVAARSGVVARSRRTTGPLARS